MIAINTVFAAVHLVTGICRGKSSHASVRGRLWKPGCSLSSPCHAQAPQMTE